MKRALVVLVVACGSPSKPGPAPVRPQPTASCDGTRAQLEHLYRAEAEAKEPKRVADAVADNTHMVLVDCAKDPARAVPCIQSAASVAELEKNCLVPLDPEGTEGEALAR
ncbi:MAG TPA: hypothetical protein VGF94_09715 [Kofleriaceae bacterium]|jgi:hypothetical protein